MRVLYEDRQGTLWVGTGSPSLTGTPAGEGGLNRFDPAAETFTRYLHDPQDETSLFHNKVMSLYEDSKGVFWVGTLGDGLHSMDREAGTFTRHRYDPDDPTKLSRPFFAGSQYNEGCSSWSCGGVSFIHEDRQGMLWIGGFGGGVNRYDRSASPAGSVEVGAMNHFDASSSALKSFAIWSIAESHDDTLWIGSWEHAYKVVSSANVFLHVRRDPADPGSLGVTLVTSLYEDGEGTLWTSTRGAGLDRFDRSTGTFTHFRNEPDNPASLGSNFVASLYEDKSGALWVGLADHGLARFDRSTGRFTHFPSNPHLPAGLGDAILILEDRRGRFWVGTSGHGLDLFNPETGEAVHHRRVPDDPESLSGNLVWAILEDNAGTLWIGTNSGLNRLIEESDGAKFAAYLPDKVITALYEDSAGRFWVGAWGDGLYMFDRESGSYTRYGLGEGLSATSVASLIEDEDGYLWISTAVGSPSGPVAGRLSRLDPETETFTNFDTQDGLPDIGFYPGAVMKSRSGMLFFGGDGGFTAFDSKTIREPVRTPPRIALKALHVFNDEVAHGPRAPIEKPLSVAEEIRLTAAQNDFTIDYAAFSYRDADQTQYQYRLDDYDTRWIDARTMRSARYSYVAPGSYVFRVRATDTGGMQSEEATIHVVVLPPWWRTTWMFAVYGLLFAVGIYGVDRFQRERLIAKEREKTRERELAQAREIEKAHTALQQAHEHLKSTQQQLIQQEKMASLGQLTAGIAHEIKNPLNFVNNFAQINAELAEEVGRALALHRQDMPEDLVEELEALMTSMGVNSNQIAKHGSRADHIVESMMEHAGGKSERYEVAVNPLVEEFVNITYSSHQSRIPDLEVEIEKNLDASAGSLAIAPQDIGRVLQNIIGNAIDAVHEKKRSVNGAYEPKITVTTGRENGQVEIRISDNGVGVPRQARERVFEPFFTTKPTGSGTGLGLSLSYDIVTQGHGGSLEMESEEGEGATFIVRLPVS